MRTAIAIIGLVFLGTKGYSQSGSKRIDTLIRLAQFHIFKSGENQIDFDSAVIHLNEARRLNQTLQSAPLSGQILLTESYMLREKGQNDAAMKKIEDAIQILEPSDDKYYLGKALYELSGYYDYNNPEEFKIKLSLVERSMVAYEKSNAVLEKAESLKMLGDLYSQTGDYKKAVDILQQALTTYIAAGHKPLQGVYILLGGIYSVQNDYKQGLYYQLLALKTAEDCKDTSMQLCQINSNLGALYSRSSRYEKSLLYYKDALKVAIKYNDRSAIAMSVFSVSKTYSWLNQPGALLDFLASLPKEFLKPEKAGEKAFILMSYLEGYVGTRQYSKAGYYCTELLKIYDDATVIPAVKSMVNRLAATFYLETKDYTKTRIYLERNAPITKTLPGTKWLSLDEKIWYRLDSAEGNYQSAFHHLLTHKTITDSLLSETKAQQFQQLEVEFDIAKKQDSLRQKDQDISVLKQRNDLQQKNLEQSNLIKNITITGTLLTLIVLALLYYQFRKNRRNNKIILQKNEELKDMLAEKEWWLKEVHHRVKNNLHTIICLLESQAMYLEKDALQAIEKSQHRIYAMSLIHQKLYQNEDLQVIDMSVYLEEFIGYLKDSFDAQKIDFIINVEPVQLNLQQAIPVGLIINEGVTNAIKYAFVNESEPKIWISMTEIDETVTLTINDNGQGFEIKAEDEGKSLGMQLIKGLSKELKGTVTIDPKEGATLIVEFKKGVLSDQIAYIKTENILNNES